MLQFDKMPKKLTPEEIVARQRPQIVPPPSRKALPLVRDTQPPEKKGTHCWWCAHPMHGSPLHLPYKYDDRRDLFTTTGEFCSWECMKAFALDMNTSRSGEIQSFIAVMRRKTFGKYMVLKAAPKRQALKIFGGPLSIEEFRGCSQQEAPVYVPYEKYICPTTESVTVNSVTEPSSNEPLKLKRDKPLKRTASKLESALGITRKAKE